jgi:hypothetical protein
MESTSNQPYPKGNDNNIFVILIIIIVVILWFTGFFNPRKEHMNNNGREPTYGDWVYRCRQVTKFITPPRNPWGMDFIGNGQYITSWECEWIPWYTEITGCIALLEKLDRSDRYKKIDIS